MQVDVVLISYNQEQYIAQALESILMQRVDEDVQVRVIVADDCSKDKTLEIIKSYEDKSSFPFVYLPAEKNMGIAANYKRAYAATEAEYVAVLEGDDWWTDANRLQKHIDYLSTHTDCVLTKNNYMRYNQRTKEWTIDVSRYQILTLRQTLNDYMLANMSSTVFRGTYLRNMDNRVFQFGYKQRDEATDFYAHIYLLQFGYGFVLNDVMSIYRVETGSNVSIDDRTNEEHISKAYMCYLQSWDLLGDNYKNECFGIYKATLDFIERDKRNILLQRYSNYIPPIFARFIVVIMPKIWHLCKYIIRQSIPNNIYKKLHNGKNTESIS